MSLRARAVERGIGERCPARRVERRQARPAQARRTLEYNHLVRQPPRDQRRGKTRAALAENPRQPARAEPVSAASRSSRPL